MLHITNGDAAVPLAGRRGTLRGATCCTRGGPSSEEQRVRAAHRGSCGWAPLEAVEADFRRGTQRSPDPTRRSCCGFEHCTLRPAAAHPAPRLVRGAPPPGASAGLRGRVPGPHETGARRGSGLRAAKGRDCRAACEGRQAWRSPHGLERGPAPAVLGAVRRHLEELPWAGDGFCFAHGAGGPCGRSRGDFECIFCCDSGGSGQLGQSALRLASRRLRRTGRAAGRRAIGAVPAAARAALAGRGVRDGRLAVVLGRGARQGARAALGLRLHLLAGAKLAAVDREEGFVLLGEQHPARPL